MSARNCLAISGIPSVLPLKASTDWREMTRSAAIFPNSAIKPVGHAVGHELVRRIAADVVEGEHGDRACLVPGLTNADELLAQMNARTNIDADHSARLQAEIWSADGNLRRPLIMLHSAYDGLARTEAEGLHLEKVRKSHDLEHLVQVFTAAPGHCSFSTQQYMAALAAMERWLDTGDKPEPAAFPSTLGFAPGYVPAPWPFPEPRCRHRWPGHPHWRGACRR